MFIFSNVKVYSAPEQGRQLAALDVKIVGRRELRECDRHRTEKVSCRRRRTEIRRAERRKRIGANLNKVLEQAVVLLKKHLAVAQTGLGMLLVGKFIILP